MTDIDNAPDLSLDALAAVINTAHEAAERTARTALEHARAAGDALLLAKARVAHGQWLPWLGDNCPRLATRTAQAYMQLSRGWASLTVKYADPAHLTLDGALQLLAAPADDGGAPALPLETSVAIAPDDPAPGLAAVLPLRAEPRPPAAPGAAPMAPSANDDGDSPASLPYLARNTGNNEWHTPAEYLDAARAVLGGIDLDPASNPIAQATVRAARFFTLEDDGLTRPWHGRVWLNPPYSQPAIQQFADKLVGEWTAGNLDAALVLTNNASDTRWFHLLAATCTALCLTRGRIGFESPDGDVAANLRGQAFFYFGPDPVRFHDVFARHGLTAQIVRAVAA